MTEEKVCIDRTQMNNIIDAARADATGTKAKCKKALQFVRGYRPIKKKEPKDPIESWVGRKITSKIEGWVDGFF